MLRNFSLLTLLFFYQLIPVFSQESPELINYQAVARDANGDELGGVELDVEFSIYEGSATGSPVYVEGHFGVLTDPFGLFTLEIGDGVIMQGDFSSIDWSDGTYLNVGIDAGSGMTDLGTFQLISVPYALYSTRSDSANYAAFGEDADADPSNELQQLQMNGSILSLTQDSTNTEVDLAIYNTDAQQLSIDTSDPENVVISLDNSPDVSFSVEDADADSLNEIQVLSKTDNLVELSNNGGSFIDEVDDADADPSNELQTLSKTDDTVTLSDGGGSFTDEVDDADADPNNELQTLSKTDDTVTLSDGGGSFTDEVDDADADPNNEIQSISKVGSIVTLSNGGGSYTDEVVDADADDENELISSMIYNAGNNNLTINEAGTNTSVDLSDLKEDENWTASGQNISNSNAGNVGINESNPTSSLQIMGSTAAKVRVEGPSGSNYLLGDETIFIGIPDVGDVEVDLPSASDVPGRIYAIKKAFPSTFNDIKIHANGSDLIEGVSTYLMDDLSGVYEQIIIVSDGVSDWWIISKE